MNSNWKSLVQITGQGLKIMIFRVIGYGLIGGIATLCFLAAVLIMGTTKQLSWVFWLCLVGFLPVYIVIGWQQAIQAAIVHGWTQAVPALQAKTASLIQAQLAKESTTIDSIGKLKQFLERVLEKLPGPIQVLVGKQWNKNVHQQAISGLVGDLANMDQVTASQRLASHLLDTFTPEEPDWIPALILVMLHAGLLAAAYWLI